jgi:O-antigen ligase
VSTTVLVLAGVALAGFVVVALLRPRVSLLTLVALDVSNLNTVIAEHVGTSPYRPQLALAVLVVILLACRRRLRFAWSPVLLGLLVLTGAWCLSFVHAADPVTSLALLGERVRDLFYAVVVLALVLSTRATAAVTRVAVLVLSALAGLTVVHEFVLHNVGDLYGLSRVPLVQEGGASTARHAGTSSDVNFWARLLILFVPPAFSLLAVARRRTLQVLWAGCVLSLLLGIYLTQSRGGFIAVTLAVLCWLALAGGWWRRSILAIPVALLVLVPLSGIGSRLLTLATSATGTTSGADLSVLTRKRLQLDALRMFLDSPVFGHGIGSYGSIFTRYDRLSGTYLPVDIVVAAHNFYLEQAADGGVVLLLGWGVLAGTVVLAALRARQITLASPSGAGTRYLASGVVAGVLGWAVASVFLHLSDFRALLLVAVIAAALDVEARRLAVPAPVPRARVGTRPELVLAAATTAVLVTAAGATALTLLAPPRYEVTATLAVVPATSVVDGSAAYQADVISRGTIVPTLTQVLRRTVTAREIAGPGLAADRIAVDVTQSPLGGSVLVQVTAPTAAEASTGAELAVTSSRTTVTRLRSSYELAGTIGGATAVRRLSPLGALALVPGLLVGALVLLRRRRSDRPAPPVPRRAAPPVPRRAAPPRPGPRAPAPVG